MISAINSVSFQRRFGGYSTHTPKMRPYKELEFMPELQKQNFIKIFIKNLKEVYKSICNTITLKK